MFKSVGSQFLTIFALCFLSIFVGGGFAMFTRPGLGQYAANDMFALTDLSPIELGAESMDNGLVLGATTLDPDMVFTGAHTDFPLYPQDYYYGKYINARAGSNEINKIPVLVPGNRIRVIRDGYVTLYKGSGYIAPGKGFYYGSGLCWSTSTLGGMMDNANAEFQKKWGMPLFVFQNGDRVGHNKWYKTYELSNAGYGYSVIKLKNNMGQDYSFTINPEISQIPELNGLKVKIVMTYTDQHPTASYGQSLGAHIVSNKDIFGMPEENKKTVGWANSASQWFQSR